MKSFNKFLYSFIVLVLVFSGFAKADIITGLVAHYEFEGNANDTTGTSNGTVNGTLSYSNGQIGQAGSFNGSTSITVPDIITNDIGAFTFSTWFKASSVPNSNQRVFSHGQGGIAHIAYQSNGSIEFCINDNVNWRCVYTGAIPLNEFNLITATYTQNTDIKLYLNGEPISTYVAADSNELTTLQLFSGYDSSIGAENSTSNYINGEIDDLRVYNRDLTPADIVELYKYNTTPKLTLKAHGGAVQFDGSTGGVVVTDLFDNTTFTNQITMEAWVNPASTGGNVLRLGDVILRFQGADQLMIGIYSGGEYEQSIYTIPDTSVVHNHWNHIAMVYDGDVLHGYINGTSIITLDKATDGNLASTTGNNLGIGAAWYSNQLNEFLTGSTDEVRIWNTARSQTEIIDYMNSQLDGNETGLVAYYNFDERLGDTVKDITSNENDGTIDGNVTRLNFLGDGLSFDGDGDNVIIPHNTNLNLISTDFSISHWVKFSTNSVAYSGTIFKRTPGSNSDGYRMYIDATTGRLIFDIANNQYIATSGDSLIDNKWHYLTVTFLDSDNSLILYVDGNVVGTFAGNSELVASTSDLYIGDIPEVGVNDTMGNIAEVSIWNKSLTQTEIKHLMLSSPQSGEDGLMGYWPLSNGSGDIAYDRSGQNNNGTITGATWTNTAPEIYGDTIYTDYGISSWQKLVVENNTTIPSYSITTIPSKGVATIDSTSGLLSYSSNSIGDDNLTVTDGTISQTFKIKSLLPNDGCDVWDGGTNLTATTTLSNCVNVAGDLDLSTSNNYIDLFLEGYKLTVYGNLIKNTAGIYNDIDINNGTLEVYGDMNISAGNFNMNDINDTVIVHGTFKINTGSSNNGKLTDGDLILYGDFVQSQSSGVENFGTTANHKVSFVGDKKQTISFGRPQYSDSRFTNVDFNNTSSEGIEFLTKVVIDGNVTLNDTTFTNVDNFSFTSNGFENNAQTWPYDIYINGKGGPITLTKDINISQNMFWRHTIIDEQVFNLAGYKLNVDGNITHQYGNIILNSGELNVTGNYVIDDSGSDDPRLYLDNGYMRVGGDFLYKDHYLYSQIDLNNGELEIDGDFNITAGYLIMDDINDTVKVHGDFIMSSYLNHTDKLTNGSLILYGDFIQSPISVTTDAKSDFYTTLNHKVIFDGNGPQSISFSAPSDTLSHFANLQINSNSDISLSSDVYVLNSYQANAGSYTTNGYSIYLGDDTITFNDNALVNYKLDLQNIVLAQDNITAVYLVDTNTTQHKLSDTIEDGNYNYNLTVPLDHNYSIIVEVDNSTNLWYNFNDGQLYQIKDNESDFITSFDGTNSSFNLDATPSNLIYEKKLSLKAHGAALQFDGDYANKLNLGNISAFNGASSFTIETWIKPNNLPAGHHYLFHKMNDSDLNSRIAIIIDENRQIWTNISNGTSTYSSAGTLSDDDWHHVAFVYDGLETTELNRVKVYIDGVYTQNTGMYNTYPTTTPTTNGEVYVGSAFDGMGSEVILDEFRIWNTPRTQSEIFLNMNQQLDGNETGLVAYYNFDERNGSLVKDITSNGNDGTIEGNVTRLNFLGDTLSFNGTSDFVWRTALPLSGTELSIGAWINPSTTNGTRTIVRNSYLNGLFRIIDGVLVFEYASDDNITNLQNITYTLPTDFINSWHYVSATLQSDGTNTIAKLYIDGQEVANATWNLIAALGSTTTEDFGIGANVNTSGSNSAEWFEGKIAEVSIWNKALTQTQIQYLMASSPQNSEDGLVGYWPLNYGSGATAYDRSSNSNDGNITGATWTNTAPTIYGDTIYTDYGINSWEKVILENNITIPNISVGGTPDVYDNFTNGLFFYSSTSGDQTFSATDSTTNLTLPLYTKSLRNILNDTDGTAKDDVIILNSVSITSIDGGDGDDTLVINQSISGYTITDNHDGTYILNYGSDNYTLSNIEYIKFSDTQEILIEDIDIDLTDGLVAHYEFEDDINDSTTNSYNLASDVSTPTFTTGKIGKAADFDVVRLKTDLNTSSNTVSYSFWIKADDANDIHHILASYSTESAWSTTNAVYTSTTELATGTSYSTAANGIHLDSSWRHIVVTSDGSTVNFYIDGNSYGSVSTTLTLSRYFYLGDFGSGNPLRGAVDDIRIYNRALSSVEVTKLNDYISPQKYIFVENVNLSENNITNIFIVDADNYNGEINTTNTIGVNDTATLLADGTTSFSETTSFTNYLVVFETDMGTANEMKWYYNQTDGKLYTSIDNISNFINNSTNISIDLTTLNWIDNSPKLTLKAHGGAVQFDGVLGNKINLGDISELNGASQFTLETWVNVSKITGLDQYFFSKQLDVNNRVNLVIDSTGRFAIANANGANQYTYTANTLNVNQWYHVAFVYDGSGADLNEDFKLYINGNLETNYGSSGTSPSTSSVSLSGVSAYLGSSNISSQVVLDEFRIWNTARNETQIKETMNRQLDGNETGLVAYYNFDERIGSVVKDITGNYDGTIEGNATRLNFLGDGLKFNGTSDFVWRTALPLSGTELSIGAWINPSTTSGTRTIVRNSYLNGLFRIIDGVLAFEYAPDDNSSLQNITYTLPTDFVNSWHYVSATLQSDGTNTIAKLYIDGEEVANKTWNLIAALGSTTTEDFGIGANVNTSGSTYAEWFEGKIAEVSIWNKALTQTQIQYLMASSPQNSEDGLVGYWPLNYGSGATAYDRSSNSNDGNITGASWTNTAPTIYGDTIYTDYGINSWEKVILENNITIPNISVGSTPDVYDNFTNGLFFYSSTSGDQTFSATDSNTSLTLPLYTKSLRNILNDTDGTAKDDVIILNSVSITSIDGGDGDDTLVLSQSQSNYTITKVDSEYIVDDNVSIIKLINIENLNFTDSSDISIDSAVNNSVPIISDTNITVIENNNSITIDLNISDDDNDTLTYTISGTDANEFDINSTSGFITFITTPDYETKSSYELNVSVSDGYVTMSKVINIIITDDASDNFIPLNLELLNINLSEHNITNIWVIGQDGNSETFTMDPSFTYTNGDHNISSPVYNFDNNFSILISIDDNNSIYYYNFVDTKLYEDNTTIGLVSEINSNNNNFKIDLNSSNIILKNTPPKFNQPNYHLTIFENNSSAIFIVDANDSESTDLNYSISGVDSGLFDINTTTSQIRFKDTPDYETVLDNDYNNIYEFNVTVSDGEFNVSTSVDITVSNIDELHHFEMSFEDINITEDINDSLIIPIIVTDEEDQNITFTINTNDSSLANVYIDSNSNLHIYPYENSNGTLIIDINATIDSQSILETFTINIEPVNDNPTFNTNLTDLVIEEDNGTINFELNVSDIEYDELNVTVESNNTDILTISPNWTALLTEANYSLPLDFNITTVPNAFGLVSIKVVVSDGELNSTSSYDINITAINDAPLISTIDDINLSEDFIPFTIELNGTDIDKDSLLFSATSSDTDIVNISVVDNNLTVVPVAHAYGIVTIDINVTDGSLSDTTSFEINISSINDIPVISGEFTNAIVEDGSTISGNIYIDDNDTNESLFISTQQVGDFGRFTFSSDGSYTYEVNSTLTQYLNNSQSVTDSFTITSFDNNQTRVIDIIIDGTNDQPTFNTNLTDLVIEEDNGTINFELNVSDIEYDELNVTVESNNTDILTISPNWTALLTEANYSLPLDFNITTVPNAFGLVSIKVVVSDGELNSTSSYDINITAINDAPLISTIDDINLSEDFNSTILPFEIYDIDSDNLEIRYTTTNKIVDINLSDSNITINSKKNLFGTTTITIEVHDGNLTTLESFDINISSVDDKPYFENDFTNLTPNIDQQSYEIALIAKDEDNDTIELSVDTSDKNLAEVYIDFNRSTLHIYPYENNIGGTLSIELNATSNGITTTTTFDLNIEDNRKYYTYEYFNIPSISKSISSTEYNYASANNILTLDSFYTINGYKDQNGLEKLNISKLIPQTNNVIEIDLELDKNTLLSDTQKNKRITVSENIVNINSEFEVKYSKDITKDQLSTLYNQIDHNITFDTGSLGYIFYEKQLVDRCEIYSNNMFTGTIENFIYNFTNRTTMQYLAQNRYNSNKILVFDNQTANGLIEIDTITQETKLVGSWEQVDSQSCILKEQEDQSIKTVSTIKLTLNVDGYDGISYHLLEDGSIYEGYIADANSTKENIILNDIAIKSIMKNYNFTTIPTLKYPITKTWTYLSLPTNMTLCRSNIQQELLDICNQEFTIESVFENIDMVLKYTGDWSYWDNSSDTYNMDKFSSLNHKEGLLIKSAYETTLQLPYDIFSLNISPLLYTQSDKWYLIGNQFDTTPEDILTKVDDQNKTLQYILKSTDDIWNIYAPQNDQQVDSSIPRIDSLNSMDSFWIYVK